ncbi:UNVERIFIED_ORG: hypothetical protein OKW15_000826 [Pseudomonas reinekei]|nr:hypothetical protein [Pseudomonas reinekei]
MKFCAGCSAAIAGKPAPTETDTALTCRSRLAGDGVLRP